MKNPYRTIFVNHSSNKYLIKLQMNTLVGKLIISYSIHNLLKNNLAPMIESTLANDPEADIVDNNNIPTKLAFKSEANSGVIGQDFPNIQNLVNVYKERRNELIKVSFLNNSFWFTYDNLFVLYAFLNSYITNYDVIKLRLLNPVVKEPIKEEEKETSQQQENVIQSILKLSPNPIVNYYVIKWINNNNVFGEIKVSDNDINLKINHPFDFDILVLSNDNSGLINQMLQFVNVNEREDNIFKIKTLFRYLYNILIDLKEVDQENYILLQITIFLMFLYGCRVVFPQLTISSDSNLEKGYPLVISKCIEIVSNEKTKKINIEFVNFKSVLPTPLTKLDIKTISEEYKYLIKIDEDSFIDKILQQPNQSIPASKKLDIKSFIGSPKIIKIKDFLDNDSSGMLSYKTSTKDPNVISTHYNDILTIENGGKVKYDRIDPLTAKWSDIIINHIFKKIDKSCVNTFEIMDKLIEPYAPEDTTEQTKLWILYQIIIPHMYNLYGTTEIIDYFH